MSDENAPNNESDFTAGQPDNEGRPHRARKHDLGGKIRRPGVHRKVLQTQDGPKVVRQASSTPLTGVTAAHVPTETSRERVSVMRGIGLKRREIAAVIGISLATLDKHYDEAMKHGKAILRGKASTAFMLQVEGGLITDTDGEVHWIEPDPRMIREAMDLAGLKRSTDTVPAAVPVNIENLHMMLIGEADQGAQVLHGQSTIQASSRSLPALEEAVVSPAPEGGTGPQDSGDDTGRY